MYGAHVYGCDLSQVGIATAQHLAKTNGVAGRCQLVVASVIPGPADIEVPEAAQILVQFNRGVAPLTFIDEERDEPVIEFDPPIAGTGAWLNTSLYRFIPDTLAPSTTYRLRIPAGLTSAADGALEADYEWSFQTISPALEQIFPPDNTKFVSLHANVELTFNQPMVLASIEPFARVRTERGARLEGAWTLSDDGRVATFDPAETLAVGERYHVTVPRGLRSVQGERTSAGRESSFRTLEEPRIVQTVPFDTERSASRWGVTIRWNNPMDLASFEELVTISGIDADDIRMPVDGESERLSISVRLEPSTEYTVTLAPGGRDRDGQVAPGHTFSFTTGSIASSVSFAKPGELATYSADATPELYY